MSKTVFQGKEYAHDLSHCPGIYMMYDINDKCLYVGKASSLKNRVGSYFSGRPLSTKVQVMVNKIHRMNVVTTGTQAEALLLESNLIKQLHPRYNVQLRDDKSYPYIYLDTTHPFPRLSFYRGRRKVPGKLFGPYPSARSVRETLALLQKIFPVRQCQDSYYNNRSRPCLQFQIKRCPAPCVDLVSQQSYSENVELVRLFLEGKSDEVISLFTDKITALAQALEFEQAALYRDRLQSLQKIYQAQNIEADKASDIDLLALVEFQGTYCVAITFVRSGRVVGTRYYSIKNKLNLIDNELMESFLAQYYYSNPLPSEVIVNLIPTNQELLEQALGKKSEVGFGLKTAVRGERNKWLTHTLQNALNHLQHGEQKLSRYQAMYKALKNELGLVDLANRIECFDISHSSGEATVAACVVFDAKGPVKAEYRRFSISGITGGDDYAAMEQALQRRYSRLLSEAVTIPEVILIDGGKGQLNSAQKVIDELGIKTSLLVGVAKGEGRRPGLEKLVFSDPARNAKHLSKTHAALHLIQQIRDEAHRFAITGHRRRRDKTRLQSQLEKIPGIGAKRRKALLLFFGGIQGIKHAGTEDLQKVDGISHELAKTVYKHFH